MQDHTHKNILYFEKYFTDKIHSTLIIAILGFLLNLIKLFAVFSRQQFEEEKNTHIKKQQHTLDCQCICEVLPEPLLLTYTKTLAVAEGSDLIILVEYACFNGSWFKLRLTALFPW